MNILKYVHDLGSDSLAVFGGKYEGGARLQQVPDEIASCVDAILRSEKEIKNLLEIGSASGGNIKLFNHFLKLEKIVIIDDNQHPTYALREKNLKDMKAIEIIGNSHNEKIIKKVKDMKINFDIILIDGDHTFSGVKQDLTEYSKFLSDNGLVMFHDTVHWSTPGVKNFVAELKRGKDFKLIGEFISKIHPNPCGVALFQKEGK